MKLTNSIRRGTSCVDVPLPSRLRQIPGVKTKSIPNELTSLIEAKDERTWIDVETSRDDFKPWQHEPFSSDRQYDRSTFLTYETGLGKTPVAVRLTKNCDRILIVTAANHRYGWVHEYERWAECKYGLVIEKGSDWAKDDGSPTIIVCTAKMLPKCGPRKFDGIIFDESQAFKNSDSQAWKAAMSIVNNNPNSIRVLLSATPAANEPKDLWAQLELLWPGRFGTQWQFLDRYCITEKSEYGTSFSGINPDHAKELEARFAAVTYRATKLEAVLGGHIPPLVMNAYNLRRDEDKLERMCYWALEQTKRHKHIGVFFFHPESARQFVAKLLEFAPLFPPKVHCSIPMHGGVPPKKRMREIERMKSYDKSISICTIEAMGEAIDLTYMERVALCEYTFKPSKIVQFLGRFQRLSCMRETVIDCFAKTGTEDEAKVIAVGEKLEAIRQCVKEGASESAVSRIMSINEDAIFEDAKKQLSTMTESGGLL